MASEVVPVAKSLYLCDEVVEDPGSRKVSLLGTFNATRPSTGYPYQLPRLCVFAQLIDAEGELPVWVEIVNADDLQVIFLGARQTVRFASRNTTVSVCFRLSGLKFFGPGTFIVELYCGNALMDDRVLHLLPETGSE